MDRDSNRQTGRTTRQLQDAITFVRADPAARVAFVVGNHACIGYTRHLLADLTKDEPELAKRIDVRHVERGGEHRLRGLRYVAFDHAYHELTRPWTPDKPAEKAPEPAYEVDLSEWPDRSKAE